MATLTIRRGRHEMAPPPERFRCLRCNRFWGYGEVVYDADTGIYGECVVKQHVPDAVAMHWLAEARRWEGM